jgi:DNA-binding transcriptional regulator YdaS (Cro superfamily)
MNMAKTPGVWDEGVLVAIQAAGGIRRLANLLGIRTPSIYGWPRVPAGRVLEIEKVTDGVASRYLLRPDLYPTVDAGVVEGTTRATEAPQADLGKEPTTLVGHPNIDQLAAALDAITEQRIAEAFGEVEIIIKDVSELLADQEFRLAQRRFLSEFKKARSSQITTGERRKGEAYSAVNRFRS